MVSIPSARVRDEATVLTQLARPSRSSLTLLRKRAFGGRGLLSFPIAHPIECRWRLSGPHAGIPRLSLGDMAAVLSLNTWGTYKHQDGVAPRLQQRTVGLSTPCPSRHETVPGERNLLESCLTEPPHLAYSCALNPQPNQITPKDFF